MELVPEEGNGMHKTVTPGKAKAKGVGNGAPDTTMASGAVQVKKVKIAAMPTTSTIKFCLANAFTYLGIPEALDEATMGRCRGEACKFTHVSGAPARTYGHVAVSAGVTTWLTDKDTKAAWLTAMRGKGREVFHGPYAQG